MTSPLTVRHFVSYSGVKLPLKLHTELDDDGLRHRITFFRGHYTADESLSRVEKVVYGEIEFTHDYQYHDNGQLSQATVTLHAEEERTVMRFAPDGELLSSDIEAD